MVLMASTPQWERMKLTAPGQRSLSLQRGDIVSVPTVEGARVGTVMRVSEASPDVRVLVEMDDGVAPVLVPAKMLTLVRASRRARAHVRRLEGRVVSMSPTRSDYHTDAYPEDLEAGLGGD